MRSYAYWWQTLFFFGITFIFVLGGVGLFSKNIVLLTVYTLPLLLFLIDGLHGRKIVFPKKFFFLFSVFFLTSFVSVLFSVNQERSFEYFLLYLSCALIALSVYNHTEECKILLPRFIVVISVVLICIAAVLMCFPHIFKFLIPMDGYQIVFSRFGSHNHLGDFLVVPLLLSFYTLITTKKIAWGVLIVLLTPFFLFSYSRSAYVSFSIPVFFMLIQFIKTKKVHIVSLYSLVVILIIGGAFILFFATVQESKYIPVLRDTHTVLSRQFSLKNKYFRARRVEYFDESLYSIGEKPFFGVGPSNFSYASAKYTTIRGQSADSSHNLFLDIFVENGVIAGIIFVLILFFCIKNAKKDIFFLLFLALLINFQSDYTFRIYPMILLFFVLLGLIWTEKTVESSKFI